jgi:hypothetical protein
MRQLLAGIALSAIPAAALAAMPTLGMRQIVLYILVAIGLAIIFGGLIFLIRKAPFIPADVKQWIEYLLYALVVIAIIFVILGLIGA